MNDEERAEYDWMTNRIARLERVLRAVDARLLLANDASNAYGGWYEVEESDFEQIRRVIAAALCGEVSEASA